MKTFGTRTILIITAIAALICGLMIPAIQAARDAAMEMSCRNNIKQVGLALLNYESTYRRLPLAIELRGEGQLWRSWRSQIYPTYMEQMASIYDASTAWDSPTNLRLLNGTPIPLASKGGATALIPLKRVPWCFACPKCSSKNRTGVNYVVVRGDGTAFPNSSPIELSDVTDGLENTLLVVESLNCTPDWTEPRDLDFETMDFTVNSRSGPSISSLHTSGALVCFADLKVFCITSNVNEAELRALLTIAGGENVSRDDLVSRGVLIKR